MRLSMYKKENRLSYTKLLLIAFVVTLNACALPAPPKQYIGTNLDETGLAKIHGSSIYEKDWGAKVAFIIPLPHIINHYTGVDEIDGQGIFHVGLWFVSTEIFIEAGQHTAKLSYSRNKGVEFCDYVCLEPNFIKEGIEISFIAEENHEYRFFAYIPDDREWVWVEDITDGKVIAGEKPKDFDSTSNTVN